MIDHDAQLKLQALLDGELPEREAAEVRAWLEANPEAQSLQAELRNTCAALGGHEAEIKLPESREFFWPKIQREIRRQEAVETPAVPKEPRFARFAWWRRALVPLGGLAVMALSVIVLMMSPGHTESAQFSRETEVASADMDVSTYSDQQQDATVIWHSEVADDTSSGATVQQPTP